jgi:hypothetical protein
VYWRQRQRKEREREVGHGGGREVGVRGRGRERVRGIGEASSQLLIVVADNEASSRGEQALEISLQTRKRKGKDGRAGSNGRS